jgi:hypothetical protein
MMTDKPNNPAAFPDNGYYGKGMTLRDWFAGQALAHDYTGDEGTEPAKIALWAYQVADAMLAAREASND